MTANSVIGLQLDGTITSDRASVEDRVEARVVRDVRVGNDVAIPAGARALGSVMLVERGGKFKDRARLGIRFHTLVLADGTRLPITSETIFRNGDAPATPAPPRSAAARSPAPYSARSSEARRAPRSAPGPERAAALPR